LLLLEWIHQQKILALLLLDLRLAERVWLRRLIRRRRRGLPRQQRPKFLDFLAERPDAALGSGRLRALRLRLLRRLFVAAIRIRIIAEVELFALARLFALYIIIKELVEFVRLDGLWPGAFFRHDFSCRLRPQRDQWGYGH
jgi:hypothetical protein